MSEYREIEQLTPEQTREGYDRWSASYDDGANPMIGASEWLLDREPLGCEGLDVLEIGCGTGRNIARVLAGGARSYTGVDPSSGMLERARGRIADARVRLVAGDAAAPPVDAAAFDLALVVLVLEHLPALDAPMRALAQALRPGGRLRLIEIHPSLVANGTVAHFAAGDGEIRFASTAHPIASLRAAIEAAGLHITALTEHVAAGALLETVPRLAKHRDAPVVVDVSATKP
jgi:malonyl-CoA O-methyltransferase